MEGKAADTRWAALDGRPSTDRPLPRKLLMNAAEITLFDQVRVSAPRLLLFRLGPPPTPPYS
jgi:hypothetical protein